MRSSTKNWKYLSICLIGILGLLALMAAIPANAAVPELRGSLLEKILFTIETTHGVAQLDFVDHDLEDGQLILQSILDEGNGYFGDYHIRVTSGGQHVMLFCVGTDALLVDAVPGVDTVFEGKYTCGGIHLIVEDTQDENNDAASTISGAISFTKGGFLEFS